MSPAGTAHTATAEMRLGLPPRRPYRREHTATAAHTPRAMHNP